ncbi:CG11456 [Drosophila busckii]|uniref:CG11456 n=1 Tax=Drosophila busckii TaxID=30019 RepID=A0A0M4EJ29_DROBS|nr:gastrula zinc finger protein XlCGF8.2DB [Drosophila busckii]ALC42910.1 CG11456 [Drosophila busckii]
MPVNELGDRIVYVCSLCLRQYDLLEDLRGHFMCYHGHSHVDISTSEPKPKPRKIDTICEADSTLMLPPSPPPPPQLQPMPFKEFRIVLRANMRVACTEGNATCIFKFKDDKKLELHVKCHKGAGFACSECGLDFSTWRRCSAHLWKAHQIDVDLLKCPCVGCDYKAPVSALVWRHMRVHSNWRARVLRHDLLRRRAQKAQLAAAAAAAAAVTSSSEEPSQSATPKKKTKYYAEKTCETCNRKFVNGKTLSKHIKTVHNKIKPFICNVCGKKTARKASLIIHMRQHTGEKPLTCEQCKFSTRDPSSLFKHRQRHNIQAAASAKTA